MRGKFITFEGPEGSGKTTIIKMAAEYLQTVKGVSVLSTREPGGIEIAEQIREVILNPAHTKMDARTEALLYAAARRQHLVEKVIPALEEGKIVLCDRFIDSSLAYQGYARDLGIGPVMRINEFAIEDTMPDLTFFLDINPEKGLCRIKQNRSGEINRLDLEKLSFHEKVYEGYWKLIKEYPDRFYPIDAEQNIESVLRSVKFRLHRLLINTL